MTNTAAGPLAPAARPRGSGRWLLMAPAVLFLVAFFVLPLFDNGMRSVAGEGGLTLSRYVTLLTDAFYLKVTAETVLLLSLIHI